MEQFKVVFVGDGSVGKTCMLVTYTSNVFPMDQYVPTVFDQYTTTVTVNKHQVVSVNFWDTAGQDGYERLRPLSYPRTNVFVLCFSLVRPESFENILAKWYPEVQHYCNEAAILLVGTKLDLRDDKSTLEELTKFGKKPISTSEGLSLASRIRARYIECSALTLSGLNSVFEEVVNIALQRRLLVARPRRRKQHCTLL